MVTEWISGRLIPSTCANIPKYGSITYLTLPVHVRQNGRRRMPTLTALQLANVSQILYGPIIFVTKLSILLLYLRVFAPSTKSKTYFFIQILIWVNLLFYLASTLVKIFECTPRSKIWHRDTPGTCVNINSLITTASIFNVVSDFLILLLPIACVWRLQMKLTKKLGTSAVFAAGALYVPYLSLLLPLAVSSFRN